MTLRKLLPALAAATIVASAALAEPVLTFANSGTNIGTVSYDGAGGALIASNLELTAVVALNTPQHAGAFACVGCRLNFTTGGNIAEIGNNDWLFAGGGTFAVNGTVKQGATTIASGLLLSGWFDPDDTVTAHYSTGTAKLAITGFGFDQKSPDLLSYFGLLGVDFSFANQHISATGVVRNNTTHAFAATANQTSIANTATVPEPASLGLLGLGLAGLGLQARRRRAG